MSLRDDAIAIWKAGLAAVDSAQAVSRVIAGDDDAVKIAGHRLSRATTRRIEIVGAGKAGAGMATGLEAALLAHWPADRLSGWINVPADCVRPLQRIHLHAARPAGLNEPTAAAVEGTREILRRVDALTEDDVCIVLMSGGASALLCDPVEAITLDDKLQVTRLLASSGATIQELNCVRSQLSRVKAGGLARACNAGQLIALIISDVIGDPLDVIGSGPTVISRFTAADALRVLRDRDVLDRVPERVVEHLRRITTESVVPQSAATVSVVNHIIASNAIALEAAAAHARQLGYEVQSLGSANAGDAAEHGRELFQQLAAHRNARPDRPLCLLSGGEPTVKLWNDRPAEPLGIGGRNQELVLAAIAANPNPADWHSIVLLSGGTDGEDGPTDAAGAVADEPLVRKLTASVANVEDSLQRHDSWSYFNSVGGHLKTGPTHTNVMDVRVGLSGSDVITFKELCED